MKLRKWVRITLGVIAFIAILVMASDCENTWEFIISHLIACGVFTLSTMTLIKYS